MTVPEIETMFYLLVFIFLFVMVGLQWCDYFKGKDPQK
jgi:hypothetical protein